MVEICMKKLDGNSAGVNIMRQPALMLREL